MSQSELTQIGKYQIVSQVGEGAMGVVYRATDPVLNRPVAIKVMSDALARDDDLRGRFLREAQAAGSLQHPNVITIYDFGEVSGHLYIAMEFVEGEDLEDLLDKHVTLTLADKLDIVIDVLSGLAYAHKHGIIHRDIKPANIRIGEEGRARIMDFGIAHLSSSNMTRTGVMVGTPAYMAPEQIVGSGIVPATDVFSVGAVLFELLSGRKPFQGDSLQNVMYKIVSQPPPELGAVALGIPEALDQIIQRALAKDVKDRYQSAVEMANALTAVRAGLDRAMSISKSISLRSVIDTALADERIAKARQKKRRAAQVAGSIAAVAIASVAIGVYALRPTGSPKLARPADSTSITPIGPVPALPSGAAPKSAAAPIAGSHDSGSVKRTGSSLAPPQQATPKPGKPDAVRPSDALVVVRTLQNTALEARRRASEAGATGEQLKSGDSSRASADTLVAAGKLADAAAKLNDATAAWVAAERDARLAASTAKTVANPQSTATAPAPAASAASTQAATVAPVNPPAPPPVRLPTANPTTEVELAVAAYSKAIESRDIAEVRRAYPSITSAQASGFEQFFAAVRSLRATFTLSNLDVNGASADGKIVGSYDYLTTSGKTERQAVSFQASFRRDASGWKLASVR